jgi:hypothetical protein
MSNKLMLFKLPIRSALTYTIPVWSNTSSSNYRQLQILQSKCLRVIGNYPRRTPTPITIPRWILIIRTELKQWHLPTILFSQQEDEQ